MSIIQKIKDKKFERTFGEKARLKDIEERAYQKEMEKIIEKKVEKKGILRARRKSKRFLWKLKNGFMGVE